MLCIFMYFFRVKDHFLVSQPNKKATIIKFGEKLRILISKKFIDFEANLTRGINPEILKIVTLLDQSHSEMPRDITFGIDSSFGIKKL